ncbi:MAG: CPBP family intramembrane metalloprotease [Chloroflexota bacterium]|nr:CPBP family intramembrane metalloprotease [Chloroflexota bacterium]
MSVRAVLVALVLVAAGAALLATRALTQHGTPTLFGDARVDGQIAYQVVSAFLAVGVVLLARAMSSGGRRFLVVGELGAPARPVGWLGISAGEPWTRVGRNFAIILTVATAAAVYFQIVSTATVQLSLGGVVGSLPIALPFAASNAAVEEAIFRLAPVEALDGILKPGHIAILSGVLFGVLHYFGIPGGLIGVALAGFLGWLLTKSITETRGVFWAWSLHFLQDLVIFTAVFATSR